MCRTALYYIMLLFTLHVNCLFVFVCVFKATVIVFQLDHVFNIPTFFYIL